MIDFMIAIDFNIDFIFETENPVCLLFFKKHNFLSLKVGKIYTTTKLLFLSKTSKLQSQFTSTYSLDSNELHTDNNFLHSEIS